MPANCADTNKIRTTERFGTLGGPSTGVFEGLFELIAGRLEKLAALRRSRLRAPGLPSSFRCNGEMNIVCFLRGGGLDGARANVLAC